MIDMLFLLASGAVLCLLARSALYSSMLQHWFDPNYAARLRLGERIFDILSKLFLFSLGMMLWLKGLFMGGRTQALGGLSLLLVLTLYSTLNRKYFLLTLLSLSLFLFYGLLLMQYVPFSP